MKIVISIILMWFAFTSCHTQKHIYERKNRIFKGYCKENVYYYNDSNKKERLILDKREDSIMGKFILSGEIDIHKVILEGCLEKCDSDNIDKKNLLNDYCIIDETYLIIGLISYYDDLSNNINKVYEVSILCCPNDMTNHKIFYLRLKKEGNRLIFKSFKIESNEL